MFRRFFRRICVFYVVGFLYSFLFMPMVFAADVDINALQIDDDGALYIKASHAYFSARMSKGSNFLPYYCDHGISEYDLTNPDPDSRFSYTFDHDLNTVFFRKSSTSISGGSAMQVYEYVAPVTGYYSVVPGIRYDYTITDRNSNLLKSDQYVETNEVSEYHVAGDIVNLSYSFVVEQYSVDGTQYGPTGCSCLVRFADVYVRVESTTALTGMLAVMSGINTIRICLTKYWSMVMNNAYMATLMGGGLICLGLRIAGRGKRFARFG